MTRLAPHRLRTPRLTGVKARIPEGLKWAPKRWQAAAMTAVARRLRADVAPADALLVTSTPRSGSTWLFELLAADPTTFPLFEPFHPRQNPRIAPFADELGYLARPTAPANGTALRNIAEEIYAGRELTRWSTNRTPRRRLRHARRTLIKEVRISRALDWFVETLPVPTVVLIRHPCAVVDSMLRATPEDWNRWSRAQVSAALGAALSAGARSLDLPNDRAVLLAAVWAADVRCAIEAIRGHDRSMIVSYEILYQDPRTELDRIGALLGLDTTGADAERPSLTTLDSSPLRRGGDPVTSWQSRLPAETVHAIIETVHRLGVLCYTDAPHPDPAALDRPVA